MQGDIMANNDGAKGPQSHADTSSFDAHLKWLASQVPKLLLPLLNWLFDCEFDGTEEVTVSSQEKILKKAPGLLRERRSDFRVTVRSADGRLRVFLFECQTKWDGNILRRIVEYTFVTALAEMVQSKTVELTLHPNGLLYLGPKRREMVSPLTVPIRAIPDQGWEIKVPVRQLADLSPDDIIGKALTLLIPFYPLTAKNRFKRLETNGAERDAFLEGYRKLYSHLSTAVERGELTAAQLSQIQESAEDIIVRLLEEQPVLQKGMMDAMSEAFGYVPLRERLTKELRAEFEAKYQKEYKAKYQKEYKAKYQKEYKAKLAEEKRELAEEKRELEKKYEAYMREKEEEVQRLKKQLDMLLNERGLSTLVNPDAAERTSI